MGIETAIAIAGVVASVAGGVVSYQAQQQQAKAKQAAANANADMLERQAKEVEGQKQEQLKVQRREARQAQAEAEAKMSASGLDISRGSAGSILADYAQIREEDSSQIALEAERRKRTLREDAALQRATGAAAVSAGSINATGSLISAGGKVADRWYAGRKDGVF